MDAVDAMAEWWIMCKEMHIERTGYVFRARRYGSDEVSVRAADKMVRLFYPLQTNRTYTDSSI